MLSTNIKNHFFSVLQNRKYEPAVPFIDEDRKCRVWVEKVFRGRKLPKECCIESASYKMDYRLLSKNEEAEYCKIIDVPVKLISPTMGLPPLLREFILREETGSTDPQMRVKCNKSTLTNSRIAKEGETANIILQLGLGEPSKDSRYLYEGILTK